MPSYARARTATAFADALQRMVSSYYRQKEVTSERERDETRYNEGIARENTRFQEQTRRQDEQERTRREDQTRNDEMTFNRWLGERFRQGVRQVREGETPDPAKTFKAQGPKGELHLVYDESLDVERQEELADQRAKGDQAKTDHTYRVEEIAARNANRPPARRQPDPARDRVLRAGDALARINANRSAYGNDLTRFNQAQRDAVAAYGFPGGLQDYYDALHRTESDPDTAGKSPGPSTPERPRTTPSGRSTTSTPPRISQSQIESLRAASRGRPLGETRSILSSEGYTASEIDLILGTHR